MKVLLINGSPNKERCTYTALREVADALEAEGVDCEFAWIGRDAVRGWRCTYTALREVADALEAEGVDCEFAWIGRDAVRGCLGCGACSRKGEGRCVFNDDVANGIIEQAKAADGIVVGTPVFYAGANGVGCGACSRKGEGRCVFNDDVANGIIEQAKAADGIVVGTPVFYAGANGALLALLDRMFMAAGSELKFKPAAAIASARRAGTTPAIDQVNKYFQFNCMPLVSSNYWPMVHGSCAEDVERDEEGLQIMRTLGRNMQVNKYFQFNCMPLVSSNYWPMVHGSCAEDVERDEEGLQIMRTLGRNMAWMLKSFEAARAEGIEAPTLEPKVKTNFIR